MQSANSTSKKLKNYPNMQNIQRFYKNYCKCTERNQSKILFNLWCQDTQRQKNVKSPEWLVFKKSNIFSIDNISKII